MRPLFIALMLCLGYSSSADARIFEGTDQGNGGDAYAAEFVLAANYLTRFVNEENSLSLSLKAKYATAVREVQVESTDAALFLQGKPKDALNFPGTGRILFNRQRWIAMGKKEKIALVLHEYFGVMGEESASYAITAKVIEGIGIDGLPKCAFGTSVKDAPAFLRPPRHMNASSYVMAEASYRGSFFSLRSDGNLVRLEARDQNGLIVASASSTLDLSSIASRVSLSVTVTINGNPVDVACEGYTAGFQR